MVGNLSDNEMDRLVLGAPFGHLGCHADGKTVVVPISFAVEDENTLVGQTSAGIKVDLMRKNPSVCLCIDQINELTEWQSVILWGKYEELSGVKAAQAIGLLIDKYGPGFQDSNAPERRGRVVTPPRLDQQPLAPIVYRIIIEERSGRFERPR